MVSKLIPIQFNKIIHSQSYTVFILGNPVKQFAIYTAPYVGKRIQMYLQGQSKPRPHTHDLINQIFKGLNIDILHVLINEVEDTLYYARLLIKQHIQTKCHMIEVDSRPSDSLCLALENDIPLYCTQEVFEKAVAVEG